MSSTNAFEFLSNKCLYRQANSSLNSSNEQLNQQVRGKHVKIDVFAIFSAEIKVCVVQIYE